MAVIAGHIFRVMVWIALRIVWLCRKPFEILRLFEKKKTCPPIKNDILMLPAWVLAEKIRKRELTSEEIVRCYIDRIEEVNPLLNAVIEERFHDALEEAKDVEDILNSNLTSKELEEHYPYLGVPITVKGSLAVEGLNHSAGVLLRNKTAVKNADIVSRMREKGAIPLLVSNTPEFCLNWETTNKLIGTTNNPYDTRKTVGGSTGGEAALISSGASIIGLGSDVAGSIRFPMHCCGVWGHKPSPKLISIDGHYPNCDNPIWPEVFQTGAISRYATDLSMLFENLIDPSAENKLHKPIDVKKMKVYYFKEIKNFMVHSVDEETRKTIEDVISFFNNFTETSICKEIRPSLLQYAAECSHLRLLLIDDVENLFEGRGKGSHFELIKFAFCLSKSVFTTIAYGILRWWLFLIPNYYIGKLYEEIENLRRELLENLDDQSILILPVVPLHAAHHGDVLNRLFDYGYCSIFNTLGFPVTVCPVRQSSEGLPIGIQVVAAPYCDRLCLAAAKEIEKAFGGWRPPSIDTKSNDKY